jgi:hypothetical protein
MDRYDYTVRLVSVPDDGVHQCTGRIVSVFGSSYNPDRKAWYLTVLVERPVKGD